MRFWAWGPLVALTLLAAFASDSWGQSQRKPPPREEPKSTQRPTASDQRGTEQFPAIVKVIPSPKTTEEAEADRKDREDKNRSDWWLVRLTGALAIIGALQLAVFGWQGVQLKLTVSAAKEASALSKNEFISSHRPRIILRDIWYEPTASDLSYMLFNTGGTAARIIESWILVEFISTGQPIRPLRSFGHNDFGPLIFAAGEMKDLTYSVPSEIGAYMLVPDMMRIGTDNRRPMVGEFYFTGAILYADDAGNHRRSVFRRQWDKDRKCFVRLDDPDQEYAD